MPLLATGHKRTGACPTFEQPVLQRDGFLVRVPLVGGALTPVQVAAIAEAAAVHGNGTIELTNRGNLQVRGLREADIAPASARLRSYGLGGRDAALVTISPFAAAAEHALRIRAVAALDELLAEGEPLSPKFVVHVDDAAGTTAARRAEAVLALDGEQVRVRIDGLGEALTDAAGAVAAVRSLASACRSVAADARVADAIDACGLAWLHAVLPIELDGAAGRRRAMAAAPVAGPYRAPNGEAVVLAGPRFGRTDAASMAGVAALGIDVRVTPWRSIAVAPHHRADLAALGFIVDDADPAAGIVSCIGAAGCWQTEADTWAEAERIARAPREPGLVHVSGCDKRCATRGPVAVTLLGRTDGSGFDRLAGA
ncbi:MAG: hypothetical protein ACTHN0_01565 [Aquihabitans sp.]